MQVSSLQISLRSTQKEPKKFLQYPKRNISIKSNSIHFKDNHSISIKTETNMKKSYITSLQLNSLISSCMFLCVQGHRV